MNELNGLSKLDALKYLVDNFNVNSEWKGAGLADILTSVINDEKSFFSEEYLNTLLDLANNY